MLGFQFHPESILTNDGSALLKASIEYLVQQGDEHAN
jgi:anthranilate/para-aminobenzoate synthase component II